ncbi:MAG TPA: Fe(3+) ABC transporter substrate-binding protein [Alphaproteobacteria bacterium]|nr:Fe(3+) ABC transporter substrate-binding protein [Alphaproteobacteria bacterium]
MRFIRFGLGTMVFVLGLWAMAVHASAQEVNVYSARHYKSDQLLFDAFTKQTGIKVNVIEGDVGPLLQRLQSEGRNSPADLFITADVGNLWRAEEAGVLQPVKSAVLDETIPAHLRDPNGQWYGLSQRARILVYNKEKVQPAEIATYESLADPKWKGRILVRTSSHVYNQSLIASMIAAHGPEKTEQWVRAVAANLARPPKGGDTDQIKAVAAGEGDVAISNSYYFARLASSDKPEDKAVVAKLGIVFPNQGDRGTHVNISGAGVTKYAPHRDSAIKLLEFLVAPESQKVFAEGNNEYPVRSGVPAAAVVASWGSFKGDPVGAATIGKFQPDAVKIADRAGWR